MPQVVEHRELLLDCADVSIRNPRGVPEQAVTPPCVYAGHLYAQTKEILLSTPDVSLWIFLKWQLKGQNYQSRFFASGECSTDL